jgi:peroxiredoxin Q/BCP
MKKAPGFSLPDQYGNMHSLKDYAGHWLVLYFYPGDETSGCTKEACDFRDSHQLLNQLGGAKVVGISKDSVESHKNFAEHHGLTFTILSDPELTAINDYGAWKAEATSRDTFIINPEGEIVKEYRGVDPDTHVAQILSDLKNLQGAAETL